MSTSHPHPLGPHGTASHYFVPPPSRFPGDGGLRACS